MTPIGYGSKSDREQRIIELEEENTELQDDLEQYEAMRDIIEGLLNRMTATTTTDPQLDTLREIVREK